LTKFSLKNNTYLNLIFKVRFIIFLFLVNFLLINKVLSEKIKYDFGENNFEAINLINLINFSTGYYLNYELNVLNENEIKKLISEKGNINELDNISINCYSKNYAELSDLLLTSMLVSPIILNSDIIKLQNGVDKFYFTSLFSVLSLNYLTKNLLQRERPFVYNESVDNDLKFNKDARLSFFSGHTSMAFCIFMINTLVTQNNNEINKFVMYSSLAVASFIAYLRVVAGKHFLTDVLAGAIVGTIVPLLLDKYFNTKDNNNIINNRNNLNNSNNNNILRFNNFNIINLNLKF